jgi:peptidyl-prolyl cis-trans isomerase SurA
VKKILCLLVAGTQLVCCGEPEQEVVTGLAVVVNNAVITKGEIDRKVAPYRKVAFGAHGSNPQLFEQDVRNYYGQTIEEQVERKLILHEFVNGGYLTNLLEAYVDDRIRDYIKYNDYGDHARLVQTLHAQGQTYESFRREQREDLIVGLMINQNSSNLRKILISPLKVEQYYQTHQDKFKMEDQVKLRMIALTNSPDGPFSAAKQMGEEILAKIDAGTPFAEMAEVYSSGSGRAEGGDQGWVDRGYFRKEVDNVAFSLHAGQHSGVIETADNSCFLIMVEDLRLAHVKPLSEVRGEIERTLKNDESLRLKQLWIERLKRKSYISYY